MEKFTLKILVKNNSRGGLFITPQEICPLVAGKVRNNLPVDRQVDRLTVIFMTVVPPVDRDWIQRAAALCRSTARSTGAISREQSSLAVDQVGRPAYLLGLLARLYTSIDRTSRPTSASVNRPGRPADSQSSHYRI